MNEGPPGRLIIISGPSGAGKSTVLRRLLANCRLPLKMSVSATTRPRRKGEENGQHYHFLSSEEFHRRREQGDFLECEEVFGRGDWYGTLRTEVDEGLAARKWVILEIDVAGAQKVMQLRSDAITIFLHPGSMEALAARLKERGTETPESLARRLEVAKREMAVKDRYEHEVINDDPDRAAQEICQILTHYQNA